MLVKNDELIKIGFEASEVLKIIEAESSDTSELAEKLVVKTNDLIKIGFEAPDILKIIHSVDQPKATHTQGRSLNAPGN